MTEGEGHLNNCNSYPGAVAQIGAIIPEADRGVINLSTFREARFRMIPNPMGEELRVLRNTEQISPLTEVDENNRANPDTGASHSPVTEEGRHGL